MIFLQTSIVQKNKKSNMENMPDQRKKTIRDRFRNEFSLVRLQVSCVMTKTLRLKDNATYPS